MISICCDSVYVHKLTGIIYALCCSCLLLCRTHFGPDTVWAGSNLHNLKRVNDGKGESAGSDVTISPEGRRSTVGPMVRSQTAANKTQSALQAKENSKQGKNSRDELHSVLMAVLDDGLAVVSVLKHAV